VHHIRIILEVDIVRLSSIVFLKYIPSALIVMEN
jgi:hypothetical protein